MDQEAERLLEQCLVLLRAHCCCSHASYPQMTKILQQQPLYQPQAPAQQYMPHLQVKQNLNPFPNALGPTAATGAIAVVASVTSTPRWRFPLLFFFFFFFLSLVKFSNTTQALCRQHTMCGGQCMVLGSGKWAIRETYTGIRKCRWLNNSPGKASTFVQCSCLGSGT